MAVWAAARRIARASSRALLCAAAATLGTACDSRVAVGTWQCLTSPGPRGPKNDAGQATPVTSAIGSPWATGFEDGFCGYEHALGYCYTRPDASYELVTEPVHSGERAAAFHVNTDAVDGEHTRCVREGKLPNDAYYGAWYYFPALAQNDGNWNLVHFQGGSKLGYLYDVSVHNDDDEHMSLYVVDNVNHAIYSTLSSDKDSARPPPLPLETWVHLEFRWLRKHDTSGAIAVSQDDQTVILRSEIQTDNTDEDIEQWYVGNYADKLTPTESTLFVDDVSIRPGP